MPFFLALLACTGEPDIAAPDTGPPRPVDPTADWLPGDGPATTVSGRAFVFGPSFGESVVGATVAVWEAPEWAGVVAEDESFTLEAPTGAPVSFVFSKEGFTTVQSGTFTVEGGVDDLGFQVPTDATVALMAAAAQVELDPERCHVATTVSSLASPPYGGPGVGEPDAVVTIDPAPADGASGPIYFEYLSDNLILPNPSLTATTIDGGVLFANLPTGAYTLRAAKEGVRFTDVAVRCSPGALVNASPPHDIEVVD